MSHPVQGRVGRKGYVMLEFAGQLFGEGERLQQGTPWLSVLPQTCLNVLQLNLLCVYWRGV